MFLDLLNKRAMLALIASDSILHFIYPIFVGRVTFLNEFTILPLPNQNGLLHFIFVNKNCLHTRFQPFFTTEFWYMQYQEENSDSATNISF